MGRQRDLRWSFARAAEREGEAPAEPRRHVQRLFRRFRTQRSAEDSVGFIAIATHRGDGLVDQRIIFQRPAQLGGTVAMDSVTAVESVQDEQLGDSTAAKFLDYAECQ